MSKTIHVLSGCPGSGKSTYAEQCKTLDNYYILGRDETRDIVRTVEKSDKYFPVDANTEYLIWSTLILSAIQQAEDGDHIMLDQTCCDMGSIHKLFRTITRSLDESSDKIVVHIFDTPLETCLERNAKRKGRHCVPENVIYRMFNARLLRCGFTAPEICKALQVLYPNVSVEVMTAVF